MTCCKCNSPKCVEENSGETFDGGNDWIDWVCQNCGTRFRTYSDYN